MYTKNQLLNAVLWPTAAAASISLISPDGEVFGTFKLEKPMRGADLAALVPVHGEVSVKSVTVTGLRDELVIKTVVPFDTDVNTERRVITAEERLRRLELREDRREAQARADRQRHEQEIAAYKAKDIADAAEAKRKADEEAAAIEAAAAVASAAEVSVNE